MVARPAGVSACAPGPGRGPGHRRLALLGALLGCCLLGALPALADAQEPEAPPACPSRPADYEPTAGEPANEVVRELRALRQEQADACDRAHADAEAVTDRLGSVSLAEGQRVELAGVDADHPLAVHDGDQVAELALDDDTSSELVAAYENTGSVLHTDLWFLIGLLCALPFAYFLARLVMPRA